jgi:hypothetical protein
MPTYTVHAPPPRKGESTASPERFVFVRDGFHFWAFLLAPLWLLARRLWLAFTVYVLLSIALGLGLRMIGTSNTVQVLTGLVVALIVGFEVATLRRWKLSRRGWKTLGFVVGEDRETAERRFYAEWVARAAATPPPLPQAPPPPSAMPLRPAPGPDVIGLFPEPGDSR